AEQFGHAIPATPPFAAPTPLPGELSADTNDHGGVIVGGLWSCYQTFLDDPEYVDLGGAMTSDYLGTSIFFRPPGLTPYSHPGSPDPCYQVVPSDRLFTRFAAFYTHREGPLSILS